MTTLPSRRLVRRWLAALGAVALVVAGTIAVTTSTVPSASAATTAGCGKAPTLSSGTHTIQSGGQSRSFILRIPDSYNNTRPYRLIFGFHWRGGTMNDVASGGTSGTAWAYYGMQQQSNNSAIFVAPQGIGNGWANTNGQDVTFTDDMIRVIENDLCVDTTQRFAMGFSYGGGMSYASRVPGRPSSGRSRSIAGAQLSADAAAAPSRSRTSASTASPTTCSTSRRDGRCGTGSSGTTAAPRRTRREPAAGSRTHITTTYSCRAGYPVAWAAFDGGHGPGPVDGCAGCERRRADLDQGGGVAVLHPVRVRPAAEHAATDAAHRRASRT